MISVRNTILATAFALMWAGVGAAQSGGSWISNNDYPTKALREGRQGVVGFHLVIDEQGVPESCEVTRSSGHDDLDQATCSALMRRARFKPATDEAGNPIKGTFSSTFRWVIPRD